MSDKEENTVNINNTELKESDMTDQQKYLAKQIQDLRVKRSKINFELDQVLASLNFFESSLIETTKSVAKEILKGGK